MDLQQPISGQEFVDTVEDMGAQRLYDSLTDRTSCSLQLFQQLCITSVFQVPAQVGSIQQMDPVSLPGGGNDGFAGDDETEEQLISRVASMRQEILKVWRRGAV
ncbi:hypothetical protein VOLCADRAFT_96234 [Volvox carteri f. nagariensis]|uniref:Uncharacterized protein n=1 Tax=Volvox carteri f. nagariensis TaxID=3068 RepID=D8U9K4_VOLCA|nr:uncharacterized protein VOLCADRAFT_96234 [Volvox carteri f. nagariensis]EFJ43597.1 hypothetical protein VOLCADRAFT_96234 [Volvox carteri f. nagariensis]|eukprot:XP_002955297.1 hypothetical protein VOLCADRAFT_96234 [Volvox carteri f. nagariensis]